MENNGGRLAFQFEETHRLHVEVDYFSIEERKEAVDLTMTLKYVFNFFKLRKTLANRVKDFQ